MEDVDGVTYKSKEKLEEALEKICGTTKDR